MKGEFKLKVPSNISFNFKPVLRPKNTSNSKVLSRMLYAIMEPKNDSWCAVINTKGLTGYADTTILPVTESSLSCKKKIHLFSTSKDEHNHYVHYIKTETDALRSSERIEGLCPLCIEEIYGGYIVMHDGTKMFKVVSYKGNIKDDTVNILLTKENANDDK